MLKKILKFILLSIGYIVVGSIGLVLIVILVMAMDKLGHIFGTNPQEILNFFFVVIGIGMFGWSIDLVMTEFSKTWKRLIHRDKWGMKNGKC